MKILKICDAKNAEPNQEFAIEAIVLSTSEGMTKKNEKMTKFELQDKTGILNANIFASDDQNLVAFLKENIGKKPVKVSMVTNKGNNGNVYVNFAGQYRTLDDKKLEDFTTDFTPSSDILEDVLNKYISKIKAPDIKSVVNACLNDNPEDTKKFFTYPAGIMMHHRFERGLLYHTVSMLEDAEGLMGGADKLNKFKYNRDLVYAAIIIHDFFKIKEYKYENGTAVFDVNSILGHSAMACMFIHECYLRSLIDEETELQFAHILAAHHGEAEKGAIATPATKEALLVHMVDEFNAKENAMDNELVLLSEGQLMSNKNYCLDTRVYKPVSKATEDDSSVGYY